MKIKLTDSDQKILIISNNVNFINELEFETENNEKLNCTIYPSDFDYNLLSGQRFDVSIIKEKLTDIQLYSITERTNNIVVKEILEVIEIN